MKVIQTFQRNQIRFAFHSDLKTLCVHENKTLRKIFDVTKVVMRSRKSMYRQYNGQKKKSQRTNNCLQNYLLKMIEQHEPT